MQRRMLFALPAVLLAAAVAPVAALALPTCAELATNPVYGLAGNPVITAATSALVAATTQNAAYCNVQITYSSRSGLAAGYADGQAQAIKIGIGLPLNSADAGTGGIEGAWNGKLQNLGGGGCAGGVGSTTGATNARYVGTSTDTGHTNAENGQRCDFGVIQATHSLNLGKIDDFIYEGVHQQVLWGKALANSYYGASVTRNYWNGCSTGGRQGLALAQTHGAEFDGFVVGAPAFYWQAFRLADAWPALVVKDNLIAKGKGLTTGQFNAANAAAIAACDGADGVIDSLIDDPRACTFSATANICGRPGAPAAPNCLDADQAAAIDRIWDGPRNEQLRRIWYPFDRGIAAGGLVSVAGTIPSSAAQVMSYNHRDLTFSVNNLFSDAASMAFAGNPIGGITYADEATLGSNATGDYMETQSTDLSSVKNAGGKIIMWQGTADPLIRWRHSADYYRRVATRFGNGEADFAGLQPWFRYYHAPGVGHCGGGAGPAPVDLFGALVDWVENGIAPDSILARGGSLKPTRTRPLCPWPQTATYNGAGDIDDAASFHCAGDLDANPVALCQMVHTRYKQENEASLNHDEVGIDPLQCLELESLSPAKLWLGLKSSDDVGTAFDVRVELLNNGQPVSTGLTRCVRGLARNPASAREVTVAFEPFARRLLDPSDVLSLRILTRIGTNPDDTRCTGAGAGHSSANGLRLYYEAATRKSKFDLTIAPSVSQDVYLDSNGGVCPPGGGQSPNVTARTLDTTAPTGVSAKCKDAAGASYSKGNPWKEIGVWSETQP